MASGSAGSGSGSGNSNQSTQYTPTPEETRMQKVYAGQIEAQDPYQRQLNAMGSKNILNLLSGGTDPMGGGSSLPGYLSTLPGGISNDQTAQMSSRAIKDIQPFMGQAGLLDSGVNAQISARTSSDIQNTNAQFNINNLMQLLNLGTGGQAQVVSNAQQNQSTFSQSLAGLRSSSTQGSYSNQNKTSQFGWSAFGGICWVSAELFPEGWDDPKTHSVRHYMLTMAPKWLLEAYRTHGKSLAAKMHKNPFLKALIRPFFEVFAFLGAGSMKEVIYG